jgi:tRNA wybutosine-synthesizing protein 4
MMVRNLEERGCALQGIHSYDSSEAQAGRYREAGLAAVEVMDMDSVYNYFLDKAELHRVQRLEMFDELEEWILIQQHYVLVWAHNSPATFSSFEFAASRQKGHLEHPKDIYLV